jgi:CBS domain-containing protein
MLCRDVMRLAVESIDPTETARAAARRMLQANIGFLPVCDAEGRVTGTLTDRDITIRLVAEGLQLNTPIANIMTREIVYCHPRQDIKRAYELMAQHKKWRLLVCEHDGRLVGVISLSDIAACLDADIAAATLRRVTARGVRMGSALD